MTGTASMTATANMTGTATMTGTASKKKPTAKKSCMRLAGAAAIVLAAIAITLTSMIAAAEAGTADETEIKAMEYRFVAAVKAKDANAIMANYLPGAGLVVFDVIPPREYDGAQAYKKDWQGVLASCKGPIDFELSDLSVMADPKIGFGHNIQHLACTAAGGNRVDLTFRVTDGYRKTGGKWLIVHEHISVPVDIATGRADLSSKP